MNALKRLFGPEPDESFVSLLLQRRRPISRTRMWPASLRRVRARVRVSLVYVGDGITCTKRLMVMLLDRPGEKASTEKPAAHSQVKRHVKNLGISSRQGLHSSRRLNCSGRIWGRLLIGANREATAALTFQGESLLSRSQQAGNAARIAAGFIPGKESRLRPMAGPSGDSPIQRRPGQRMLDVLRQRYLAGRRVRSRPEQTAPPHAGIDESQPRGKPLSPRRYGKPWG